MKQGDSDMKLPYTVHCVLFMAFLRAVLLITLRFVTHYYT